MTMCPGTGLLSQMIELGLVAGPCRMGELARSVVTLPVCAVHRGGQAAALACVVVAGVPAACAASRW